jgi:hypothetical protein
MRWNRSRRENVSWIVSADYSCLNISISLKINILDVYLLPIQGSYGGVCKVFFHR